MSEEIVKAREGSARLAKFFCGKNEKPLEVMREVKALSDNDFNELLHMLDSLPNGGK